MVPNVPHVQKNAGRRQARAFKTAENPYCTTVKERVNKQMYLFTATKTTSGVLKKKKKERREKRFRQIQQHERKKTITFQVINELALYLRILYYVVWRKVGQLNTCLYNFMVPDESYNQPVGLPPQQRKSSKHSNTN